MSPCTIDLSVFKKFNFESPPAGVKFLFDKPEDIKRLGKKLAFCQMLREAQQSKAPFYIDLDNHDCEPAKYLLGYDIPKQFESGRFGTALEIFKLS